MVIEGVREQHRRRTALRGHLVERRVTGGPGGSLRPPVTTDLDGADLNRIKTELTEEPGELPGPLSRARLQLMINRDCPRPQCGTTPRRLERKRGG